MLTEPRLEHRAEQPYVAVQTEIAMTDIPSVLPPFVPEVFDWLRTQGVEPAGAPFFRYLSMDGGNRLLVDVGVPVVAALPGSGRIRPGAFPAGRYAVLTHTGPYDRLRSAWMALEDWKETRGIKEASCEAEDGTRWGTRTEFYLTAPEEGRDPSEWRTELALLVSDDAAGDRGSTPSSSGKSESDLPTGLASPARRALAGAGYVRLEQFTRVSEAEVLQLHGMGPKALDQIRRALAARGLSFADGSRGNI